jgi:hypothetical protein
MLTPYCWSFRLFDRKTQKVSPPGLCNSIRVQATPTTKYTPLINAERGDDGGLNAAAELNASMDPRPRAATKRICMTTGGMTVKENDWQV